MIAEIERTSTPLDGGFGISLEDYAWNPAAAHEATRRAADSRRKYEGLHVSMIHMAGTATVEACIPAHFAYDPESPKLPFVQYIDWLAADMVRATALAEYFGGEPAVAAYEAEQAEVEREQV